jgi:hypothetical protein
VPFYGHVRDPEIRFGSFKVLQRTDSAWIVIDETRPIGKRTVLVCKKQETAARACEKMHRESGKAT